jgi:hypothetical protein
MQIRVAQSRVLLFLFAVDVGEKIAKPAAEAEFPRMNAGAPTISLFQFSRRL